MVRGTSGQCRPLLRGYGCGEVGAILSAAVFGRPGGNADVSMTKVLMWTEEPGFAEARRIRGCGKDG
jgi:hypothetical protein